MRLDASLDAELPRLLPAFLQRQRWFAGKAREILGVEVEDNAWLPDSSPPSALIVIAIRYASRARERYAMLLAFVDTPGGLPVVGRLGRSDSMTWVVECATDARSVTALLRGFGSRRDLPTRQGGVLRYGDASEAAGRGIAHAAAVGSITPLGVEQSNTSVRLDRALVFKLLRRLEPGENPEVEVSRFLTTRTTFRAMAALRGSLTYSPASGDSSTVGVLQDWIDSCGDGWCHVVALLRDAGTAATAEPVLHDLFELGVTTADFHAALASESSESDFAPEPATDADVRAWNASRLEQQTRTFRLVEQQMDRWTGDLRHLGEALVHSRLPVLATACELAPGTGFHKIRVHGDFHLGQVLRTADGFALIDFEGEPGRPLAERRRKHCALKDVAGMIRSFDYALDAAGDRASGSRGRGMGFRRLRESFVDGYLTSAMRHHPVFLPRERRAIDAWIDFFEVEKALYEVEYEISNRPAWAHIPLRGMRRLLRGQP